MQIRKVKVEQPFFSICIPQYGRLQFMLQTLASIKTQTWKSLEVCVSDGKPFSPEAQSIIDFLEASDMSFVYKIQSEQCSYDKNLRRAIELSTGEFCFLCGNDDALKDENVLKKLHQVLTNNPKTDVVITNYEDWETGLKIWRIPESGFKGSGPLVAATHYRNFSYVSGILMRRELAQSNATEYLDGTEMYQMFLGCRLIAQGHSLLELSDSMIRKDIQVKKSKADSYMGRAKEKVRWSDRVSLPMLEIGRLVCDAVRPYVDERDKEKVFFTVWKQLYLFTYPYWIVTYRQAQSWKYAFCLARSMLPGYLTPVSDVGFLKLLFLRVFAVFFLSGALLVPLRFFEITKPIIYRFAKGREWRVSKGSR